MLFRPSTLLAAAGVAVACAGDSTPAWQGTVTDSAGVAIVQNPTQPLWEPDQGWTVTEALRIGSAEGEPDYQFGMLAGIAVASDGRIVVADQQGQHLKVFAPDGTYERTIGKPGGGPGELGLGISGVVLGPSDTILVADMGNQRVNVYLLDGTFVRSFRIEFQQGLPLRWEATRDGRMVNQVRPVQFPGMPAPADSSDVIVVRKSDGAAGDTLLKVPSGKTFALGGQRPEVKLFASEPAWALYGNDVLYGVNDDYRFGVYAAGGTLKRLIAKPFTPREVSEADQLAMMNAFERLWKAFGLTQDQVAQAKQTIKFADRYPAYLQMLEGVDGSIWVQGVQSPTNLPPEMQDSYNPQLDFGSRTWDVFDAEGRYLGVVNMPPRFQPVRFLGNVIYGIQRDELDVQYVVKLQVVGSGPATE
jgi:hypothetical protein